MRSKRILALTSALLVLALTAVMVGDKLLFNDNVTVVDDQTDKLAAAPIGKGYELVWYDEFETSTLDNTKWRTDQTRMHGTNELFQTYASYVQKVKDGKLQLDAIINPWYNPESEKSFDRYKYLTTGTISTENRMSYRYGYLEISAKLPFKEGCWPGFWLRSHNATDKQINPNFEVELDVFEVFGSPNSLRSNLHQQGMGIEHNISYQTTSAKIQEAENHQFINADNLANEYHTYGFEWEPDRMAIYIDGELQCEWQINEYALASYGLQPDISGFETTMNVLFNNHLFTASSEYIPSPGNIIENHEDNLPAEFYIEYVRLYQKNDGVSKLIIGR